ncbi:STAS domain-containing protein [bacterium]|nr:STAS domain-containing protein [bacterium]PIV80923.1 MAG: anti-sigma factor antagonist [bacterium CG17_big_fil_post_rev_8_21_14_2_50_64_8]PJA73202.1 MAG: anti-sigma factor antagonist [bacterium CG_4_9_14_3_um_filter_65_15]
MKVKQKPLDKVMVLELSGKIMGGPDFDLFKGEITDLIDKGFKDVVLDFGGVPWINSTGLGILITGHLSMKNAGGTVRICNVRERVLSIFYISQLEKVFQVFPTVEEALASLG